MFEVGDLITLSNNLEYVVIKQMDYNNNKYLYLISKDGISDVMICEYKNDNLNVIKDEQLFVNLLELYNNNEV